MSQCTTVLEKELNYIECQNIEEAICEEKCSLEQARYCYRRDTGEIQ